LARFLPRRATLIVADGLSPEQQALCVAILQANAQFFRKPVRLLLVNAEGGLALAQQSLALTHLKL
jgi:hypothetical protein